MAISQADWNAIWNNGYQVGWNDRYHQSHAVNPAPSAGALDISAADWNAVWTAGFDAAYGKHVDAPAPSQIQVLATIATIPGGGSAPPPSAPYPTVYGQRFNSDQFLIMDALLNEGVRLGAHRFLLEAITYAAMGESDISREIGNGGPLQTTCNLSAYNGGRDITGQAYGWFAGGECFSSGGGFHYSKIYSQVWQVANAVEENAVWARSRGDSYARSGYSTAMLQTEAANIVAYMLPGLGQGAAGGTPFGSPSPHPHPIGAADFAGLIPGMNWAGEFDNIGQAVWQRGADARAIARRTRTHVVNTKLVSWR